LNNGLAPYANVGSTPIARWSFPTGGEIRSSPAIGANGIIYFGSRDGNFYAVNPAGTEISRLNIGAQIDSSPALDPDGNIYIGSRGHGVFALEWKGIFNRSLQVKWNFPNNIGTVFSSPAISSSVVYVGIDDNLYAIDAANGTEQWSFHTNGRVKSSPAIGINGWLYCASDDGYLYAVDDRGQLQWKKPLADPNRVDSVPQSPAIGVTGLIYIGSGDGDILAFDGTTGEQKWDYHIKRCLFIPSAQPPRFSSAAVIFEGGEDHIFVGSDQGLVALSSKSHDRLWCQPGSYSDSSPAVMRAGTSPGVLFISSVDHLLALWSASGKPIWDPSKIHTGIVTSSPAIGTDGTVYIGANDGRLYAVGSQ